MIGENGSGGDVGGLGMQSDFIHVMHVQLVDVWISFFQLLKGHGRLSWVDLPNISGSWTAPTN